MTQAEVFVRRGTIDDVDGMASILCRAWRFAYTEFMAPEFIAEWADPEGVSQRIHRNWNPQSLKLVAVSSGGRVVGFASERRPVAVAGYDAEIGALYVDPDANRMGIGRQLVMEMVKEFQTMGHRALVIEALTQNSIGCAFYKKLGGREGPHGTWNGLPSVWFGWPDMGQLADTSS